MGIVDDALDFLAFIFLAGICLAVAFGVILPVFYETEDISSNVIEDKSAPTSEGFAVDTYDGTMSKLEVILLTQVQDFGLPEPKRYVVEPDNNVTTIEGLDIPINSLYQTDIRTWGIGTFGALNPTDGTNTGKYTVKFNYGATDAIADDFYYVNKQQ